MARLADKLHPRDAGTEIVQGPLRSLNAPILGATGTAELQTVALCIADPVGLIATLAALEGAVPRLLLLSHALPPDTVATLLNWANCDALVTDRDDIDTNILVSDTESAPSRLAGPLCETRWLMTTSGTTGIPKLIPHTLATLSRTVVRGAPDMPPRWGLLYDPTRFAGMQVVLQALIGGGTLIAPSTRAPLQDQISYLVASGCTHLSATPTLWRRLLMAPELRQLPLRQITLGGEIVDQQILDSLRAIFPDTRITHIYASTEAGVGFAVTDGREGFSIDLLRQGTAGIGLKIVDDILWLRPPRGEATTARLAGTGIAMDDEGFICSGDRLSITDGRALFLGRDNGTINVGGVKIYPETVERTVLEVPGVKLVQIYAKKSPIAGALVVADVLPDPGLDPKQLKNDILNHCRSRLEREAVPAIIRLVDDMAVNAAGKLVRQK